MRRIAAVLTVATLAACGELPHESPFDPQTPPNQQARTSFSGTVTLEPVGGVVPSLAGIQVSVAGHPYSCLTGSLGEYRLEGVPQGTYTVQAVLTAYETTTITGVTATLDTGGQTVELPTLAMRRVRADLAGTVDLKLPDDTLEATGGASVSIGGDAGAAPATGLAATRFFASRLPSAALAGGVAGTALTDGSGAYVIPNVPAPLGSYTLTASKLGYVTQTSTVTFQDGAFVVQTVQLVIDPGAIVGSILVVGAADSFGVTVRARGTTLGGTPWEDVTTSDALGDFRLSGLPAGTYNVTFEKADHATVSTAAMVAPGLDTTLPPAELVRDTGSAFGVARLEGAADSSGIQVTITSSPPPVDGSAAGAAVTDASGNWRVDGLPVGDYSIVFERQPGYGGRTATVTVASRRAVASFPADLTLPVVPATVSGRVLLEGLSAPDLFDTNVLVEGTSTPVKTIADGSYVIDPAPTGPQVIRFYRTGYETQKAQVTLSPGQATALFDVALQRSRGAIAGSFALSGAPSSAGIVVTATSAGTSVSTVTDSGGLFSLTGLAVGPWTVSARRDPDWAPLTAIAANVDPNATTTLTTASLTPIATASIAGKALLEGATDHAGTTVTLTGTDFRGVAVPAGTTTATDTTGAFAFSALRAGSYQVAFARADFESPPPTGASIGSGQAIDLGSTPLALSRGSIGGQFVLASASSSAGVVVTLQGTTLSAVTDTTGAFSLDGVPVGSYTVAAAKPDWQGTSVASVAVTRSAVTLMPGSPVTLQPLATGSITGVALLEQQADASGTTATLTGTDFRGVAVAAGTTTTTAANGSWTFSGLRAGSYQVGFSHAAFDSPVPFGLSIVTGQAANAGTLTIDASRGSAGGTVTAQGAGNHSGTVVEIAGGPDSATAVTDAAGAWRVSGLRVGSGYTATYRRTGYTTPAATGFTVLASATTTVTSANLLVATTSSITGVATVVRPTDAASSAGITVSLTGTDLNGAAVTSSTTTAPGGGYALSALPQGTFTLTFSKAWYEATTRSGIAVAAGGSAAAPAVSLAVSTGTIAGQVTRSKGLATNFVQGTDYSGTVVTLTGLEAGVSVPAAVTDGSGNFRFDAVPVHTSHAAYGVTAQASNYASGAGSVTADPSATVTVAPSPLILPVNVGSVSGNVATNETGTPATPADGSVTVSLTGTAFNSTAFSASINNVGTAFNLANLPAGTYDLVATSANRSCTGSTSITVAAGQALNVSGTAPLFTFTCTDSVAPGVPILGLAQNTTGGLAGYVTGSTATVPVTTGAADALNFRGYQWVLGVTPNWSSPTTVNAAPSVPVNLPITGLTLDAANTIWVRAIDLVGNAGTAVSTTVITDSTPPLLARINTPRSWVNDTTTSVTIAGGADANFDHYEKCSFDQAPGSSCPSCTCAATGACSCTNGVDSCSFGTTDATFALTIGATLNKEKACVYARATDKAGRSGALDAKEIVSDLVPPTGPTIAPLFDPAALSIHADYADFFVTAPATDSPGSGAIWTNIAWVEVDTGSGFQALCPAAACHPANVYDPCNATCACTDPRLICREGGFYGVRMPLLGGVANQVAIRAVDVAGNVGSGASQSVAVDGQDFHVSMSAYSELHPRARGKLLVYRGVPSAAGRNSMRIVDLGANQLFDVGDTSCEISGVPSTAAGIGEEPHGEPLHSTAVVYAESPTLSNQLRIRRAGADTRFCTGDDPAPTALKSYGTAYPYFEAVSGSMSGDGLRERVAYGETPSSGNATVFVRDGGNTDKQLGVGADDVEYSVATAAGTYVHQLQLAGDAVVFGASNTPYLVASSNLRVFQASAGSFAAGVAKTWSLPAGTTFAALDDGGTALAYYAYESGKPTLHVRYPGSSGLFSDADAVEATPRTWTGPNVTDGGITIRGGHVVLVEGAVASGAYYIDHWYAGADGRFGTGDDTFARVLPSATPRYYPSLGSGLSGGHLYFQSGALTGSSDVQGVDLSAFRWDVAGSAAPQGGPVTNRAGTLFYTDGGGKLRARTSAGTETTLTGITPASFYKASDSILFVSASTQVWAYRRGPGTGRFFAADSPAATLVGTLPSMATVYAAGDGRSIVNDNNTGTLFLFEPNGALTSWSSVAMEGVPAGYASWFGGAAVSKYQAVIGCIGPSPSFAKHVCVRESGVDGVFGSGDDRLFTLVRPGIGSNYGNLVTVATSNHRVALIADGAGGPHLYVVDAGPGGRFGLDGDDVETDLGLVPDGTIGSVDIAGSMVAWIANNGVVGQQVNLADLGVQTQRVLTSHLSNKSNVVVDPSGRTAWYDTVFAAGGIFVSAP